MSATDQAGFPPQPKHIETPEEARRSRMIAVGLMCTAILFFALLDATGKYLGKSYDPLQIAWSRYAFHIVIALMLVNPVTKPGAWRSRRPFLQVVRSILLMSTTILNFWALQTLRLDQTTTVLFATPFLVAIIAGPILGEWVGPRRLAAIMVGFVGVLIAMRPGVGTWDPGYLLMIVNIICYALYNVLTRMVSAHDSASTSFFYVPMFGALVLLPILPTVWTWPDNWLDWTLLAGTGALGGLGHFMLIAAHGRAPAGVLAPFMYTQIVWMISLGWIVFGDRPDIWTLSGAAVVICSGLYLFARERKVKGSADL
jgi:drug/metabolite transporter (DMT)-like permease